VAYDESLALRIRRALADTPVTERKMFGGLAFLLGGNLACGVVADRLMVRVGPAGYDEALARPHCRPMDFTGRPMKGMVYVDPPGLAADADLTAWARRGADFAATLPEK
jgi:TfoX/Sxy family transcriptional regulator of competence genes